MGKSKFPGKPSRLVNKKRVSVLSPAGLTLSDEDNQESNGQLTAATAAGGAAGGPSSSSSSSPPSVVAPRAAEKGSFASHRKEGQHHGNNALAVTAKTSKTAPAAASLENGARNGGDHQRAATKNGANRREDDDDDESNEEETTGHDEDEGEEEEDDDDEDEEEDDEEDDKEDDDDEDEDEYEDEDDDDDEEEDNEAEHGGRQEEASPTDAGDECSRTRTATSANGGGTTAATASSATTGAGGGQSEVRGAGANNEANEQQPAPAPAPGKLSATTGSGFEMKPSSLSSALARRGTTPLPLSVATVRETRQSPSRAGGSAEDGSTRATTRAQKTHEANPMAATTPAPAKEPTDGSVSSTAELRTSPPPKPPAKKKSVTFHTTLVTTDENIVKKVYNPDIVPLAPIITRECLARPIPIKNDLDDKVKRKMEKRIQRAALQAAIAAAAANAAALNKPAECIVRPSRLTGVVLKSSANSAVSGDGIGTATGGSVSCADTGVVSFGCKDTTQPATLGGATTDGIVDPARNLVECAAGCAPQFGDKRFIQQKRSAHSNRLIKPNKRFLDDCDLRRYEIKKKNKNLAAASAAAGGAGTTVATGAGTTNGGPAAAAAVPSQPETTREGADDECPLAGSGEESRKRKDKKRSDDAPERSTGQLNDGVSLSTTPISINPFAKASLSDGLVVGKAATIGKLVVKPSQLSPASTAAANSSSSGIGVLNGNKSSNLATYVARILGKSILRQPRLQFGLTVPSAPASSGASSIIASSGPNQTGAPGIVAATEGLFTMHLKANAAKLDSAKLFSATLGATTNGSGGPGNGTPSLGGCAICGIPASTRYYEHPTKKYGVSCCDVCRKFISKMVKKLAASAAAAPPPPSQPPSASTTGTGTGTSTVAPLVVASQPPMMRCKSEGKCLIGPPSQLRNPETTKTRHIFKERCHACWLRRCLGHFQLPTMLKVRLGQTLPLTMRTLDTLPGAGLRKEHHALGLSEGNLFAPPGTANGVAAAASSSSSRILWNSVDKKSGTALGAATASPSAANPFLALHSNALSQHNSTFGSLPQIKVTLGTGGDRSSIMSSPSNSSSSSSSSGSSTGGKSPLAAGRLEEPIAERKGATKAEESVATTVAKEEPDGGSLKTPRTRSKSEAGTTTVGSSSGGGPPVTTTVGTPSAPAAVTPTANGAESSSVAAAGAPPTGGTALDKRQRIDLKGPRVKHVCRSASIVLGQPLATFPEDGSTSPAPPAADCSPSGGALENIETPPSDSAAEPAEDLPLMDRERRGAKTITNGKEEPCDDCINPPPMALSPPATPDEDLGREAVAPKDLSFDPDTSGSTEKELVIDEDQLPEPDETDEANGQEERAAKPVCVLPTVPSAAKKCEELLTIERPTTRKVASSFRPQASSKPAGGLPATVGGRSKQWPPSSQGSSSALATLGANVRGVDSSGPPSISIDFWENYDPAEVSRTGFGLILSEAVPVRALCFLCGSAGLEDMLFCVCCCEPYHQYCVRDEYNLRAGNGGALDDTTNVSLLDVTVGASPEEQQQQLLVGRFNWMCPRCTVCYSCNMATGLKVKCQKCAKHYHTTCLGTSKRLHGADRPLICAACLRCKSCSTTSVTKFIGNLPMCTPCFRLRQRGNYCPLCQKCYEDNDFDLKMMECGECRRWVHARCEGLTDEQYNMLAVLPESIEFVCKKCAKRHEATAHLWRDAVAAEFRAGLLSVVKLLSKSRQACALLKLSPRKTSPYCTCGANGGGLPLISGGRNISAFFAAGGRAVDSTEGSGAKKAKLSEMPEDSIYDFSSENSCGSSSGSGSGAGGYAVVPVASGGGAPAKCCCQVRAPSKGGLTGSRDISLVDIKQKINANEYYSLQDFHYDMNGLLGTVGSEELSIAYREFLSEAFPWFQNDTKACTDALEEAMCGDAETAAAGIEHHQQQHQRYHPVSGSGCDGVSLAASGAAAGHPLAVGGGAGSSSLDQQVPQIDIPLDELTDYFHDTEEEPFDTRICMLCKQQGEGMPLHESRLLFCGQSNWVHTNCALWSAEVFEEIDGSLQNVHSAASRGRLIKCCHCGVKGATVGCNVRSCGEHYHFPCARRIGCVFMLDKTLYCPAHEAEAKRKRCPEERNFEIARSVYVELDRRKKRFAEPSRVQFMIGALNVRRLGHVVPMFSDHEDCLVPTDFECSRLYWSAKEPWKIVSYRIRTSIQTGGGYGHDGLPDHGKNFTVDHSSGSAAVQWGLTQISRWHTSLQHCEELDEDTQLADHVVDQHFQQQQQQQAPLQRPTTNGGVCSAGDDTNDEEPQNTNDLLPPEIKDVIFEDLPHDILDGISMLDILPKLMTYEDLLAMDLKTDAPFSVDLLKEVSVSGTGASSSRGPSSRAIGGMEVDEVNEGDLQDAIGGGAATELSNDSWTKATATIIGHGVEDALLSAIVKPSSATGGRDHRDLKRSKSDLLARSTTPAMVGLVGQQQQQQQQQERGQRSGSFSWSTKQLEPAATAAVVAKRRKIAKNNLKLSDVLSLGRLGKEDTVMTPTTMTTTTTTTTAAVVLQEERRKSLQADEFPWATGGKLKISQLDGVDDICLDGGGVPTEMKIYSSRSMIEAPVKCDRCQATYRNQESYQRHLSSCEVLSTSESESETRSPRLLSPEQQQQQIITTNHHNHQLANGGGAFILPPQQTSQPQTITTDIYGNTTGFLAAAPQPHQQQQTASAGPTISVLQAGQTINLNGSQAILSSLPTTSLPITINQLSGIPIQTSATVGQQQIPLQGLQNLAAGNMIISSPAAGQGQLFTSPFPGATFQQQPQQQQPQPQHQSLQDNGSHGTPHGFTVQQNKQRFIQPAPSASPIGTLQQNGQLVGGPGFTTHHQQQPHQIISFGPNGQLMTISAAAPQHQQHHQVQHGVNPQPNLTSGHGTKKHVIYPTASPQKKVHGQPPAHQVLGASKLSSSAPSSQGIKSKRSQLGHLTGGATKTMQIKTKQHDQQQQPAPSPITLHSSGMGAPTGPPPGQLITQQPPQPQQIQLINTGPYPLIRQAPAPSAPHQQTATAGNIIFQQTTAGQPILVQQVGGGNQISYLSDQGTLTSSPVQYQLAPANVLTTPNGFAMATGTDATGALATTNQILIPNGTGGYSLIPASALQIAQPQVIGTIVQPQTAATIQCGMMATEQMMLGAATAAAAPPLEMMVTDPASGCMYLTSPSMYYGLETIVQNTVMSSQQFVSTAMQGVLSQNSSFSATTTHQVFAASKLEPIVTEMPTATGYVVLNNDPVIAATSQPVQIQTSVATSAAAGGTIFQQAQPTPVTVTVSGSTGSPLPSTLQQQQQQHVWKIEPSSHGPQGIPTAATSGTITPITSSNSSSAIVTPLKATMKTIIPKAQPQLVNKVMPNTAMKALTTTSSTEQLMGMGGSIITSKSGGGFQSSIVAASSSSSVYTTATAMTTATKVVSNIIKPITTKTTNYGKPKIVAKPVKQKLSTVAAAGSAGSAIQAYQMQQQPTPTAQFLPQSISVVPTSGNTGPNQPHLVPIKPSITASQLIAKQPIVVEKIAPPPQAATVSGNNGPLGGQMVLLQPSSNGVKGLKTVKKQEAKLPKGMTLTPSSVPHVQMISFANHSTALQQQQHQQQQPIVVQQQPFQLTSSVQQQLQQQKQQQQLLSNGKSHISLIETKKKAGTAVPNQITMSLTAPSPAAASAAPIPMAASSITITPSSQPAASITLPTAPYPMPLYSNIPTNVVNPIQQIQTTNASSGNGANNNSNTRPTNRVLPMQASVMLQKSPEVPQTPTPPPPPLKMLNQQQQQQPCSEKIRDELSIIPATAPTPPFGELVNSPPPDQRMLKFSAGGTTTDKLVAKANHRLEIEIKPIEVPQTLTATTTTTTTISPVNTTLADQQQQRLQQLQATTPSFHFSLSFDGNGTLIPIGGGLLEQPLDAQPMAQIEIKPILPDDHSAGGVVSYMAVEQPANGDDLERIDELKHSLEAETQEMLADVCHEGGAPQVDSSGASSGVGSPGLIDESADAHGIKDKISEILDNLEQQTNQEAAEMAAAQHRTLQTVVAECAAAHPLLGVDDGTKADAETERLVAELNEEFRSAATSPSIATTASTVPMGADQGGAVPAPQEVSAALLSMSSSLFAEVAKNSAGPSMMSVADLGICTTDSTGLLNAEGDADADSILFGRIRQPEPSPLSQPSPTQTHHLHPQHHHQHLQLEDEFQCTFGAPSVVTPAQFSRPPAVAPQPQSNSPKLLYEIQSQDGFTYKSTSIAEIWDKLFEAVQIARRAHGLTALPEGQLKEMAGVQMLGLKTNAIRYLLEQLPGVEKCTQYQPLYHKRQPAGGVTGGGLANGSALPNGLGSSGGGAGAGGGLVSCSPYADYFDDLKENAYGTARCEPYGGRSEYDMFSWLASRHRKQPMPIVAQTIDDTIIPRRGSGSNLPMAMRYRTLKESSKESVGVYRSHIHGRGLFCNRDIEAGEMVIEYAGELIRSTLTDKRERYYDGRGIGCYMFKIDENFVVDATMRGNAARFINHSCEPNCYSKVVDILGHKHIIIFALRRIVQGEELTYDYKFPFEDVKIPCSCGSKKCRKYLN